MNFQQLEQECASIAAGITQLKERAMIFQVTFKEDAALKCGLSLDAFYDLSCNEWWKISAEIRNADNKQLAEIRSRYAKCNNNR